MQIIYSTSPFLDNWHVWKKLSCFLVNKLPVALFHMWNTSLIFQYLLICSCTWQKNPRIFMGWSPFVWRATYRKSPTPLRYAKISMPTVFMGHGIDSIWIILQPNQSKFRLIRQSNTGLGFLIHGRPKISFFKFLSQVSNESGLPPFIFVKQNQWIVLKYDFNKTLLLTLIIQITKLWAC